MAKSEYECFHVSTSTGKAALTIQDKLSAVQAVHRGRSQKAVAADVGVHPGTLAGWCQQYPVAEPRPLPSLLARGPRTSAEVAIVDAHIESECCKIQQSWPDWVWRERAVGPGTREWQVPVYHGDERLFGDE